VLNAQTGEHRWSRTIDTHTTAASLAVHKDGDVAIALHNGVNPVAVAVDYGAGLQTNATHVFRLRSR
jgi:hypothetical protein